MPECKPRVRVFRNMNGNPAGIPALTSGIGIRYGYQVPGTLALGTRYRINAEGRTPKTEPGHWTPVGEGRCDSAWSSDPGELPGLAPGTPIRRHASRLAPSRPAPAIRRGPADGRPRPRVGLVLGLLAVGSPEGLCRTGRGQTAPAVGRYDEVADALARLGLDGPDAGRSLSTRPTPTRLGPWAGRLPTRRSGWSG
jgi:hypothetical protein